MSTPKCIAYVSNVLATFPESPRLLPQPGPPSCGQREAATLLGRHTHVGGVWAAVPESLEGSQSPSIEPLDGCPTWAQHFPDVASFTPP